MFIERELASGEAKTVFTDVGRWWGNDPSTRNEAEIGIVAVDDQAV